MELSPIWYPNAASVAGWKLEDKTLALILERDTRCGAAVLIWAVDESELAALKQAATTRAERVLSVDFDGFFHTQIAQLAERGGNPFLRFKMLVDDLAMIPERAEVLLLGKLRADDGEVRCTVVDVLLKLCGWCGLPAALPLLRDQVDWVRWHVAGTLASYGNETAVDPLIGTLRSDPDPQVRGAAAYALGHISDPRAIPFLLDALEHDHEIDQLGHSPSSISATALDNILGTNQTRIKHDDGFCSLAPWKPDYEELKTQAKKLYENWKSERRAE